MALDSLRSLKSYRGNKMNEKEREINERKVEGICKLVEKEGEK